jgi:hypothetical protein
MNEAQDLVRRAEQLFSELPPDEAAIILGAVLGSKVGITTQSATRTIRSHVLAWLLRQKWGDDTDVHTLYLSDLVVRGTLRLSNQRLLPILFDRCMFEGGIDAQGARFPWLQLMHCALRPAPDMRGVGLDGRDARVDGSLALYGCTFLGDVLLDGARVGGDFEIGACAFVQMRRAAFSGAGLIVDGRAEIGAGRDDTTSKGLFVLAGASIGRELMLHGCTFEAPGSTCFMAPRVRTGSHLYFGTPGRPCKCRGGVEIQNASIGMDLRWEQSVITEAPAHALILDGARISGCVFLRGSADAYARIEGELSAKNLQVGNDLSIDHAYLSNPTGTALNISKSSIRSSINIGVGCNDAECVRIAGRWNAINIRARTFTVQNASLEFGVVAGDPPWALSLEDAEISSSLMLERNVSIRGLVILVRAKIGRLVDQPSMWSGSGMVVMDAAELGDWQPLRREDVNWRVETLNRSSSVAEIFDVGGFEQLAQILRRRGREREAEEVLIAKNKALRRRNPSLRGWFVDWLWYRILGYGYRPFRAVPWIATLFVVGLLVFHIAYSAGVVVPADSSVRAVWREQGTVDLPAQPFWVGAYALEATLPVIKLGQTGTWQPDATAVGKIRIASLDICVSGAAIVVYKWMHSALGAILVTVLGVGVTGLVRKK